MDGAWSKERGRKERGMETRAQIKRGKSCQAWVHQQQQARLGEATQGHHRRRERHAPVLRDGKNTIAGACVSGASQARAAARGQRDDPTQGQQDEWFEGG